MYRKLLSNYVPDFVAEFLGQLASDQKRWGDTWKERTIEGQTERVFARYADYFDQYKNAGTPMPWLKVIGEAFIVLVREKVAKGEWKV